MKATDKQHLDALCESCEPLLGDLLLSGFGLVVSFFFEAEADFLCQAARFSHTNNRRNYRAGYHKRKLVTQYGDVVVKVPHLRWIHPRPSLAKRFSRIQDFIFDCLSAVHWTGATHEIVENLVIAVWTVELPEGLKFKLTGKAMLLLNQWREGNPAQPNTFASELAAKFEMLPRSLAEISARPASTGEKSTADLVSVTSHSDTRDSQHSAEDSAAGFSKSSALPDETNPNTQKTNGNQPLIHMAASPHWTRSCFEHDFAII